MKGTLVLDHSDEADGVNKSNNSKKSNYRTLLRNAYNENAIETYTGNLDDLTEMEMETLKSRRKEKLSKMNTNDNMEENYKDAVVNFLSLFRYSSRLDKLLIFIGLIAGILNSCIFTILSYILGNLVIIFVDHYSTDGSVGNTSTNETQWKSEKDNESILNTTAQYSVYTAILGVILLFSHYIMVSFFSITAANQALRIKCLFMKAVLRQDIAWFDTNNTGDFADLITGNMKRIQEGIGVNFILLVFSISESIVSLSAAFYFGWQMTLVVLAIIPAVLIIMAIVSKLQSKATAREKSANSMVGAVAEEVLSAIRTVVAFGGEEKEINRYEAHALITKAQGIKRGLITSIQMGLVTFCVFLMSATALWYGARQVILQRIKDNPNFNASDLVNVFFDIMLCSMAMEMAGPYFEAVNIARGAATKIFTIIERVPPIDSSSNDGKIPKSMKGDITLKNVCFSYPSRPEISVLNGFTLKIKSGETVALVGPSGCGKSTVIQIIQRFYDVDAGQVKIDSHNIKDVNIGWLRGNIGLVGQEPALFATTIADNIRYGNSDATQKEIESAARAANIHEFILTLPEGYNTIIGESGTQLSGGQKQRIAIARALVKDPKILLLDEATSSLDAASELAVQRALDKASQKKTTIIVAHRLSTIRMADKIVAMTDGQIKEIGTHDELMAAKGIYYQLVITQNTLNDKVHDLHDEEKLSRSMETGIKTIVYAKKLSCSERVPFEFGPETSKMDDDADNTKPGILTLLKFSLPELPYMLFGAIFAFFTGVCPTLYGILFGDILQLLSVHGDEVLSDIQYYSLLYIGLAVVIGISSFMQTFMFTIVGEALTSRIRKMAFSTMIYQDISWFDCPENNTGSLCSRLSSDASDVQGVGGARLSTMLRAFSTLVSAIVIGFYFNWKIALIAFPSVPFILISTCLENIMISKILYKEKSETDDASKVAIDAIQNIRTVASLHQEEKVYVLFKCALLSPIKKSATDSHIRGLIFGLSHSISTFIYAISIYYGSIEIVRGNMLYGDYFKIMEAIFVGTGMIAHAVAFSPDYQKAKTATARMFQLLRQKPTIDKDSKADILENWSGRVEFKNVHFNYPSRPSVKILKGLDLEVEPGKIMAIVGSSGSGKSTCVQLIERFYEPDRGELKVDGKSTKSLRVSSIRSQISLVSQEPVLFNYSLAENIAYGDNKRNIPMDEIISAAKNANIHDFISSLPQGYSTPVGDKGVQLSGGQKQRIAIARALIRNPKLLLLDEATSALDAESEKVVQDALERACSGRTCMLIAHRLNTLQSADMISVIQKGRVVEQGTHQGLLDLRGHYYNLYNVQSNNK